jgi:hypothetical protein
VTSHPASLTETEENGRSGNAGGTSAKEAESAGTVMEGIAGPSDLTIEVSPLPDQ